jgi:type IV secretion system protein VirB10
MSDDTPDLAASLAGKIAPEAVTLRAQPRPVTRLNRRTLALLIGGLSAGVLGATLWSLQPSHRRGDAPTELYNVDRISKSEGLDGLPSDYSKLPPPKVPELGPPLPGDLGPAIVKLQSPAVSNYAPPGRDPNDAIHKERWKPDRGETRAARLDAQHDSATGAAGDARMFEVGLLVK